MTNRSAAGEQAIGRGAARKMWVGEFFLLGRWYTLCTTARLYRWEAKQAVEKHSYRKEKTVKRIRIFKFERSR